MRLEGFVAKTFADAVSKERLELMEPRFEKRFSRRHCYVPRQKLTLAHSLTLKADQSVGFVVKIGDAFPR
jgi:hypothetical protein